MLSYQMKPIYWIINSFSCLNIDELLIAPTGMLEPQYDQRSPPSNFIAGRPKAALLFWFFGGFRCGVPLFIVMLVIY